MPDPNVDLVGFLCFLCCAIPVGLIGTMLIGIFGCLVLNMLFGRKP